MKSFFAILLVMFTALVTVSCHDAVLTDADAQPRVEVNSEDGYDFGMLLSGTVSATKRLIVHNPNDGVLELQSIVLRGGQESAFRINVDGMSGTTFDRPELLHIARGDSLYVLAEVRAPAGQEAQETELEDYLDISCNGRVTSIRLSAKAKKVEALIDYTLTKDECWDASTLSKRVEGRLTIPSGVTLTLCDSTCLYMHADASIEVYGTLLLQGASPQSRVRMMGDRQDKMFDNLYYCDMVGQWAGIHYHPSSHDCIIGHADIKGMVHGIRVDSTQLIVRSSIVRNSNQSLLSATDAQVTLQNSCLMNSGEALVKFVGGEHSIVHCTLANYQFWTAYPECDLELNNCKCLVQNSIVYGNSAGPDVALVYDATFAEGEAPYHFDHCLLNAKGEDDADFRDILWGEDPKFVLVDVPNYLCDPHLQDDSPARGKCPRIPEAPLELDLDGNPRGAKPNMGCYEF